MNGHDNITSATETVTMDQEGLQEEDNKSTNEVAILTPATNSNSIAKTILLEYKQRLWNEVRGRLRSGWESYRSMIRSYRSTIELLEDVLDRLLYFVPLHDGGMSSSSSFSTAWREILYGFLSLNRLAMDCTTMTTQSQLRPSYGTSLQTEQPPTMLPVTPVRIAITVLHCIMPSLLELAPSLSSSSNTLSTAFSRTRTQAKMRLVLERIKFILRFALLSSYWIQSYREHRQRRGLEHSTSGNRVLGSETTTAMTTLGLLQQGGMYQPANTDLLGLSRQEQYHLERRQLYVGRRTGRRVARSVHPGSRQVSMPYPNARIVIAELLHILRPLIWASAETCTSNVSSFAFDDGLQYGQRRRSLTALSLLKPWLATLGMDVTSLLLTYDVGHRNNNSNPLTRTEWNRRRMKLFLYLLRSPIWDYLSSPITEQVCSILQRVPVLGCLLENYLREYIWYWKHPFSSEEG